MRTPKKLLAAGIGLGVLIATTAACTPRDIEATDCLDGPESVYNVPTAAMPTYPREQQDIVPNNSTVDFRGETDDHTGDPASPGFRMGTKVHNKPGGTQRVNVCWVGGAYLTTLNAETTPWDTWHKAYAIWHGNPSPTVVGARLFNVGDGISFDDEADNWKVIGVRADGFGVYSGAYVHDDCVENDKMFNGLIDDSKFDGCFVFLSSESGGDGTGKTVTVQHSLVRLQAYQNSFNVPKYGENQHGGFFKFANPGSGGTPPALVLNDVIFRIDKRGVIGGRPWGVQGVPPGTVCDNVTIVGQQFMTQIEQNAWTSTCGAELTWGTTADWDARVATWDADHPELPLPAP